jgi:hypothetical protein
MARSLVEPRCTCSLHIYARETRDPPTAEFRTSSPPARATDLPEPPKRPHSSLDEATPDQAYFDRCPSAWQPNPGRRST